MINDDLFCSKSSRHNNNYVELSPEKTSEQASSGCHPTPKKFSPSRLNPPRAINVGKIDPENPQISQTRAKPLKSSSKPLSPTKATPTRDQGINWQGGGKKARQSASPTTEQPRPNEIAITEGNETDPKPHSAWLDRPQWHERKAPPLRRGYRNQRENVDRILAAVETPKPPVPQDADGVDDETLVDAIEEFICAGGTISEFSRRSHISQGRLRGAISRVEGGDERIRTARRTVGADAIAEEALRIASEPLITEESIVTYDKNDDVITRCVKRADNVYARKLAFQARMQMLQKWCPERYGENVKPEATDTMAERLRKARARIAGEYKAARRDLSLPKDA